MNPDIASLRELGGGSEAANYSPLAPKLVTQPEMMETQKRLGELVTLLNVSRGETPEDDGERKDGVQHTTALDEMQRLSSVMPAGLVSVYGIAKRESTEKNADGDAQGLVMQSRDLRGELEWQQKESARKLVEIRKTFSTGGTGVSNGDNMEAGEIRSEVEDIKCLSSLMPTGIFNIKRENQADDDKKSIIRGEDKPLFDASEVDIDEEDLDVSPETDELGTSSHKRENRRHREGGQRSRTSRSPRRCDSTDEAKSPGELGSRQRTSASRKTSPRRTNGEELRDTQPISRSLSFDCANCKTKIEGEEETVAIKHRVSEGVLRSPRRNKSLDESLSSSRHGTYGKASPRRHNSTDGSLKSSSHRAGGNSRSPRRHKSRDESLSNSSHRGGGNSRSPRRQKSRDETLSSSSHRGGGNSRSPRRQKSHDGSLVDSSHGGGGNRRSPRRHKSRNGENTAEELQDESMCSSTHSPRAENKTRIQARRNNSGELKDESMSSSPRGASHGGDNPIRGRRSRGARKNCNSVELGHLQLQQALQNRSEEVEEFHEDEPEAQQVEEEVAPESMEQGRDESAVGSTLFAPAKLAAGFALSASRAATNAASTAGQTAFNVASTATRTATNAATTAGSKALGVASTAGIAMNSATTAGSKALTVASTVGTRAIAVATSTAHVAAAAATTTVVKKNSTNISAGGDSD